LASAAAEPGDAQELDEVVIVQHHPVSGAGRQGATLAHRSGRTSSTSRKA
jgi:hypothetical protein